MADTIVTGFIPVLAAAAGVASEVFLFFFIVVLQGQSTKKKLVDSISVEHCSLTLTRPCRADQLLMDVKQNVQHTMMYLIYLNM